MVLLFVLSEFFEQNRELHVCMAFEAAVICARQVEVSIENIDQAAYFAIDIRFEH